MQICEKIIALCTSVLICHPLTISTWYLRSHMKARYAYSWVARVYHSKFLVIVFWLLHMWGLAFFAFALCFSLIIVLTYTVTSTHWLLILEKHRLPSHFQFTKLRLRIQALTRTNKFLPLKRMQGQTPLQAPKKGNQSFCVNHLDDRVRVYIQLQLINAEFSTTMVLIANVFLSVCILGHVVTIYTFVSLLHVMPLPMTVAVGYYVVALFAFELGLIPQMGTVKELSEKIEKRWLGQVQRGQRRKIRRLRPFGIKFGGLVQKTSAFTYLLLVSKSVKYMIIIG